MPRWSSLGVKLQKIKRRYAHVSPEKFFYNKKSELRALYKRILCWFLIHDSKRGYSIFPIEFQRKEILAIGEWREFFTKPLGGRQPLFRIFTQNILPAINNKSGAEWKFKAFIGWTGLHDLQPRKHSDKHKRRNKTSKKRNSNERNSRRRRQRNRKG